MAKKSLAKNYIYNLMYQILVTIIPLITTPYLARVLGAENIGIYSYTLSIATYFILFGSLGVAMYGQREVAYVQDNKNEYSKKFFEIFILKLITMGISLILFYLFFCIDNDYNIYYKILCIELLANAIDISWFFQGLEEFKKIVVRNFIIKIICIICVFVFVNNINDLNKYMLIYVISTFVGNLSLWFFLPKYLSRISIKDLNVFKHFIPTFNLFIPQIAIQIYTVMDKVMIGAIVDDKAEVGFYEQSNKIIRFLLAIATSLGTVMIPRMANTYANGNYKKLKEYMYNSFKFILMMAMPITLGIVSISENFVPLFLGEGYEKVIILMNIISPIIIIVSISNIIGKQYLLPTQQQKKYTISVVVGAIVNLILNSFLINRFQSIGASLATVIAELSVALIQLYMIRDFINIKQIFLISYKYLLSSIIMFGISLCINVIIKNIILAIIIQCGISVLIYFIILILLKDDMILLAINNLKSKKILSGNKKEGC